MEKLIEETALLLLRQSYRAVELVDGAPVQYLGVYVLRWGKDKDPSIGFVEWDEEGIEEALIALRKGGAG